ncbi:MAG: hypothetical protein V2A62_01445 [Candidatus Woesearchaeota archaeon]
MKTLRKIGIVTIASSLALGSALASPVAESIASFGTWGLWILGIMIGVEAIRTIASLSSGKGTVGSAAMGKMGDWIKKRAKKMGTKEVRVDTEAIKEYTWLRGLKARVEATPATLPVGTPATGPINDIKTELNKEEREERRFNRRIKQLMEDVEEFKNAIGEPNHTKIKRIEDEINALNGLMILTMARGGGFECAMEGKKFDKGTDASLKFIAADVGTWPKKRAKMLEIVSRAISLDEGIIIEMKKLEKIVKEVRNS